MSKQNALRFMTVLEKDEELKAAYDKLMRSYEEKNLSTDEWDKVLSEKVLPFAKSFGYDFNAEELKELQKMAEGEINDDALDQVVGGRGQFTITRTGWNPHGLGQSTLTDVISCEFAPDDQTFITRYNQSRANCPDFTWIGYGCSIKACCNCVHCIDTQLI